MPLTLRLFQQFLVFRFHVALQVLEASIAARTNPTSHTPLFAFQILFELAFAEGFTLRGCQESLLFLKSALKLCVSGIAISPRALAIRTVPISALFFTFGSILLVDGVRCATSSAINLGERDDFSERHITPFSH